MAFSFYKWLIILQVIAVGETSDHELSNLSKFPLQGVKGPHPFHVSVVEINHNAADKTLEITCKLFTDDFENVLKKNYSTKVDLINPPDKKAMDTLVKKYILSHFSITADGRLQSLTYLGFEREEDAVYGYLQAENLAAIKKVEITNKLMHDLFDDQTNIMHVIVNGERKSTRLDYPNISVKIEF
jgi:hypothetical protein